MQPDKNDALLEFEEYDSDETSASASREEKNIDHHHLLNLGQRLVRYLGKG